MFGHIKLKMDQQSKSTELYMYIVVNSDLKKMKKGKAMAQCCHSACMVMEELVLRHPKKLDNWKNTGHAKIVLKASESVMRDLLDKYEEDHPSSKIWCMSVEDEGRTQIPEGSLTTIAFCPMYKSNRPEILKTLKLM
jgi:PTH2 family peptidyl-tRNA hydrolase